MNSANSHAGWRDSPIEDIIPWAERLVGIVEEVFPASVSTEDRVSGYGAAYVARAVALLRSMLALAKANDRESIAIVYRVLFETWLFGVYLIRGGAPALEVLDQQLTYEQGRIAQALELKEPDGDSAHKLSVRTVADYVKESLGDEFPTRAYDSHYRVTSFHWSHGHLGSVTHFFGEGPDGPQVEVERVDPDSLSSYTLLLAMGVSLVSGLANLAGTANVISIEMPRLHAFIGSWRAAGERLTTSAGDVSFEPTGRSTPSHDNG